LCWLVKSNYQGKAKDWVLTELVLFTKAVCNPLMVTDWQLPSDRPMLPVLVCVSVVHAQAAAVGLAKVLPVVPAGAVVVAKRARAVAELLPKA
jgi:hypothetical protein